MFKEETFELLPVSRAWLDVCRVPSGVSRLRVTISLGTLTLPSCFRSGHCPHLSPFPQSRAFGPGSGGGVEMFLRCPQPRPCLPCACCLPAQSLLRVQWIKSLDPHRSPLPPPGTLLGSVIYRWSFPPSYKTCPVSCPLLSPLPSSFPCAFIPFYSFTVFQWSFGRDGDEHVCNPPCLTSL